MTVLCVIVEFNKDTRQTLSMQMRADPRQYFSTQYHVTHLRKKCGKDQESIQSSDTSDTGYQWEVTTIQLDITNASQASQEVSHFPADDHKASINRRTRKHNKNKTEITQIIHKRNTTLERSVIIFYWRALTGLTAHQPHP